MTTVWLIAMQFTALFGVVWFGHRSFWTDHFSWENERPKPMKHGRRKTDV